METDLVGRGAELCLLEERVGAALAGDGSLVLLVGEAGVGKSALASAAARHAAGRGMPVLVGRSVDDEGVPAFWPWRKALEQGRHDGLDLAPDLLDLAGGPGETPAEVRFEAVEATAEAVATAAEADGLVVVVEDLHWADDGSLRLLQRLAGRLGGVRLLLLGTIRDPAAGAKPPTERLAELDAMPEALTVRLGPLTADGVADLLGAGAHGSWAAPVHRISGGSPLLVRELVRLLDRDGRLARPATADLDVPAQLRRLVERRLAQLSPGCRALLSGCAVAGAEVDVTLVRALDRRADELLEEAVAFGVLVDDPLSPSVLRFSHDLIRGATYAGLGRTERIGWHRRLAEALRAVGADRDRPAELARHLVRAAVDATERREAAEACAAAGDAALRALDLEAADSWYGQALVLHDVPARRAELLLTRAEASYGAGRFGSALADCHSVVDLAAPLGRADLVASAAVVLRGFANDPTVLTLCDRAEALLRDEDSARHAAVLAQRAFVLVQQGHRDAAVPVSTRAMAMAERSGDAAALVGAVHARHQVAGAPDGVSERLVLGARMVELAGDVGRFDTAMWGRLWRIDAAFTLGSVTVVDAEIAALTALADGRGGPLGHWHLLRARSARAAVVGHLSEAVRLVTEARAVGRQLEDFAADGMYWAFMGSLTPWVGPAPGYAEAIAWMVDHPAGEMGITSSTLGLVCALTGDPDRAAFWYDRFRPLVPHLQRDLLWLPTVTAGGELAARLGDVAVARHCAELVAPFAGHYQYTTTAVSGATATALGRIALDTGDLDAAERYARQGVTMEERMGALPGLAAARLLLARTLAARGRPGDRVRALEAVELAAAAGRRLGLSAVLATAAPLVDELSGVRAGAAALTAREREIAGLVADGLTNRAIADLLVLSERTVETHVRNLLGKLGLNNRTQVAAWAARSGLRTGPT